MKKNKLLILFFLCLYLIIIILVKLNIINGRFYENISIINDSIKSGFYNININFFKTILNYIKHQNYYLLIYNFLLFIPLGIIIYFKSKILKENIKKNFLNVFLSVFFIFLLELIQFIFRIGFFDIDIIFLNILGFFIGYYIGCFINYIIKNSYSKYIQNDYENR